MNSGPPIGPATLAFLDEHFLILQILAFGPLAAGMALLLYVWVRGRLRR